MSKGGGRTNCIGGATARKKGADKDGGRRERDIPSISSLAATSLPGTNNTRPPLSVIGEEFLNKALGTKGREWD